MQVPNSPRFQHVVFPREARRPSGVNVGRYPGPRAPWRKAATLPPAHAQFLSWLFVQAGLEVESYRAETLDRRLPACLRVLHAQNVSEARKCLEAQPTLLQPALSAMLVGVTSFFRDSAVFNPLANDLLATLADGRSGLNVWSAGCSEGAELYSVAMLLAEMGLLGGSYLLGTDCREEAIDIAKRGGHFDRSALRNVPAPLIAKYFYAREGAFGVCADLRYATRWRKANLLVRAESGFWDLILFRNTAMYFCPDVCTALWDRLEAALRPGGVLVLGKAERPVGAKRLTMVKPCIYRRSRR